MKSMKTLGSKVKLLVAASLFTFLVVPVFAQPRGVRIEVPYEFAVGSKVLPAGTYTFLLPAANPAWVEIRSESNMEAHARIITRLGGPSEFQDGSLVFDKTGGTRILSEVWIPGVDGILVHSTPKDHSHDIVLTSFGSEDAGLSGKAAFERTCRRCHGPTRSQGDRKWAPGTRQATRRGQR